MTLHDLVRHTGGDLRHGGMAANIPAPGHSRHDRSVALKLGYDGKVLVHCFGDSNWRDVLAHLRAEGLIDHRDHLAGSGSEAPSSSWCAAAPRASDQSAEARIAAARQIWADGKLVSRTLAARYLQRRSITRPIDDQAIRYNARTPTAVYLKAGRRQGAMVAAFRDAQGDVTAVEITYLDAQGRRDERRKVSRKTVGVVPAGAAVRLDPAAEEMLVGEGVCTVLSATEIFGLPGWALGSINNLRQWTPPAGVRSVLIAADGNLVGRAAAQHLAERLVALGLQARIEIPPAGLGDWNDCAKHQKFYFP